MDDAKDVAERDLFAAISVGFVLDTVRTHMRDEGVLDRLRFTANPTP